MVRKRFTEKWNVRGKDDDVEGLLAATSVKEIQDVLQQPNHSRANTVDLPVGPAAVYAPDRVVIGKHDPRLSTTPIPHSFLSFSSAFSLAT